MTGIARGYRIAAVALAAALLGPPSVATAQEAKDGRAAGGQEVDLGNLTMTVPADWKQVRPSSSMRQAEFHVPAAEGDMQDGELQVFVFPQGAGTVQANVQRWQQQFKGADGKVPPLEDEKVRGKDVDVTRVEVAGTYVQPPFSGGGSFPNYRLLGAIIETPQGAYFFKFVGPDKTILAAEKGFDEMIASMATK